MAILFDAPVEPDDLTTFVRQVPVPRTLALSNLFPTRNVMSNSIDFAEIVQTNRTARYRSYDGRLHVSERDLGSEKRVKLAPLSSSLSMGEYERLQLAFAQTGGTNQQSLANAVYNDAQTLTGEVLNRIEQAWGDVLVDGKFSPNEEGFQGESDYGLPAEHSVSAGTTWATIATAPALTNIQAWVDVYVATNGFAPGYMLTSLKVTRLLQRNTEVISAAYGATAGRTSTRREDLNNLLSDEGLPQLLDPYDGRVDVDGTDTRVIPDDKVIFLPPNIADLGYLAMGISATALELVNSNQSDLSFEDAPGIVGVVEKAGPPYRQYTFVDAVGQPVLTNAKRLMVADVIS
jgi:hypothetical protein